MTERVAGRGPLRALTVVMAVLLLGGCSPGAAGEDAGGPRRPAPASSVATPPATDAVPAVPAVAVDPSAAAAAAVELLRAWVRTELDAGAWWSGIAPLLSPTAADAAVGTDPALVPATSVTGDPTVLASGSPWLALVDVPTDAGPCRVLLSWDEVAGRWSGERITCGASP